MKQFSKDLGNVSLAPKGKWNREQEYERLALVYNACDNLSYVAKINVPSGVDIENREYWQPMNATGYADNNFINLTTENENGTITAYESIEEAVATILPINRRAGATLSFYNLNADRLDRQAEFELWQFNSTDLANWENRDYWNNIYYNWNVFAGWYVGADALKNHVETPNVGQYAYVGSNLNDAILYQCRTNGTWTNTGIKVRNYISVVVSGNITIGENGNWFSDGEDTGIPATPSVDEQLDNIITKHESLSRTVQGIAATGGASTATNVTYNNDASGLNAENAQDAIDELATKNATKAEKAEVTAELEKKFDKESILQESGEAEDKVMSQKAITTAIADETTRAKAAEKINAETITNEVARLDEKINDKTNEINVAKEEALQTIAENEQSAIANFNAQRVTPEMLSESTKQLIETSGGGTITNLADDEDITSVDDNAGSKVLKFADRTYNPDNFSGKGYKILRKNIVNGINILTRNMVSEANTVYIVKYDFTINSYTPLPSNVSFIFDGGSFYAPSRSKIIRSKRIEGTSVGELIHLYGRVGNSVRAFYQEEIMVNDIGFINVIDYGIDNRGVVDVTEKLNKLFKDFARGIPYYSSLVFYFPKGTYLISDTLIVRGVNQTILGESISNSKTSFINDGTIFKYIGESGTFCFSYEKGTSAGCNFKNITLISEGCTVDRKVIETEEDIWNGTNAQHFILYNETKPNIGAIELQRNKWIDNCLIYGFSNCAIKTSIFNKIDNTYITNCNTGILIENTDYKSDTIIDNCYISYCKNAIIGNNAILVRNCWIDEIAEHAIYNNYKDNKYALTLEMHSTHINHIDYACICGRFDRVHISGCTLNRCGCYYAGYKYSNVPKEDKSKCSTLYIERCYYALIEFNQSGLEMLDKEINGNKGGHCSVVPIIFAGVIHNIYINVSGRSNEMIPVINENNSEIIDSYIIYNGKRYDINKKCFIDEKGNDINTKYNGTTEQRPTDINIGFQYFDTDLNKPIYWTGSKWVYATGADV